MARLQGQPVGPPPGAAWVPAGMARVSGSRCQRGGPGGPLEARTLLMLRGTEVGLRTQRGQAALCTHAGLLWGEEPGDRKEEFRRTFFLAVLSPESAPTRASQL